LLILCAASAAQAQGDPLAGEDELAPEGEAPAEGEAPSEGEVPPEGQAPAEGEVAAEGQAGFEAGVAAEGEVGAEGEVAAEGAVPGAVEPEPPATPPVDDPEEIIVTGSRVKRSSYAQPSAIAVVDRKQLSMSGANNMADVVRNMNINTGSETNTDVSGATGTAQFNLRGLGLNSTLVLLNGRRLTQSGALATDGSNFVDINTIPISAIERIEILKGGASAIYGSDAVAGVVNIITRRKFDGFEAQVGGQVTDDFDHGEWDVGLLGGAQSDRTRVMGTIGYFKREPLEAEDRDFTLNGRNISTSGWPSVFAWRPVDPMAMTPGTLRAWADFHRDAACGVEPNSRPATGPPPVAPGAPVDDPATPNVIENGTPQCIFDFNEYFNLMMDEERITGLSTVEHDLSDHTYLFFDFGFARNRALRTLSPSFALAQAQIVPTTHQYIPDGVSPNTDPMGMPRDIITTPARWIGRIHGGDFPPYEQFYSSDTFHAATGIAGDFGGLTDSLFGDWEWQIAGTWSRNNYRTGLPDTLRGPLQTALNSCNPMTNPAECWNPFSSGPPNSAMLDERVTGELKGNIEVELTTVGADIGGPIVELPGGDLAIALGVQTRREAVVTDNDHDSNIRAFNFLLGSPDWQADRRVLAGYGELSVPFMDGFELQAAGRAEHFDDIKQTSFNPMAGISWTPATTFMGAQASQASKVRIRGTYASSFRAPSLLQTQGTQTTLTELFDWNPVMGVATQAMASLYRGVTAVGNPNLDPEKANAITAGLEWQPINALFLSGDFWVYNYEDLVFKEDAQRKIAEDALTRSDPQVIRDPATGQVDRVEVDFINASSINTYGIDGEIKFASDFGGTAGTFGAAVSGTYMLAYKIPLDAVPTALRMNPNSNCSGDECNVAGLRNFTNFARSLPKLRATIPISWTMDGHTAAVIGNYIGSYKDDASTAPPFRDVESWLTFDLQYSLRIEETEHFATTIKIGVINLLDQDPPELLAGLGYDVMLHDPRGRMLYARLIQEF
jgi:iron complex outermembrane receptor protein